MIDQDFLLRGKAMEKRQTENTGTEGGWKHRRENHPWRAAYALRGRLAAAEQWHPEALLISLWNAQIMITESPSEPHIIGDPSWPD
jgi:hypothetical protein